MSAIHSSQDVGLNSWKVVFVFVPSEIDLEVSYNE